MSGFCPGCGRTDMAGITHVCPPPTTVATGRVLNFAARTAGLPSLIVCPRCAGQAYDRGSCGLCGNIGYLLAADASRLAHVDAMQIAATFALALDLDLRPADPAVLRDRERL